VQSDQHGDQLVAGGRVGAIPDTAPVRSGPRRRSNHCGCADLEACGVGQAPQILRLPRHGPEWRPPLQAWPAAERLAATNENFVLVRRHSQRFVT